MVITSLSIASLALAANLAVLTPVPQESGLKLGDPAPALQIAEWVKGQPIDSFATGQTYIIEFWATW
ncbi:MAG: hypothetical protein KDB61_05495 [Planctomycetes bacterium]|nr:hypothetical protein [Planctomycetota bacterium]